tara:strand:+ start:198 stop:4073 length:3876 start_codon:yes stop_codon:yes gene_type:complete
MAICKHIKAKHCGQSGPYTHDFPCSTLDGALPTSGNVGDKFYIPNVNYNVWGCDGYVITGVYGCGTLPTFSALNCNSALDVITCGVDANGDPLFIPGVTSPSLFGIDCQDCYDKVCPTVSGCTDPLANNYDPNATFDNGSCTYNVIGSADHCYCCFQNNPVGVIQSLVAGQSCSSLNGSNGFTNCSDNWLLVECNKPIKPTKHCYCCDGNSPIGINQTANPLPIGQDCSYYNTLAGFGWYNCDEDYTNVYCDDNNSNNCECCDNGVGVSVGPSPVGTNCSWFNTLGYTNCDQSNIFDPTLCGDNGDEHCACCKNGQMTMIGLPLPIGQNCGYWSGQYGWSNCTGHTYFNIDECEDCGCLPMAGTGRSQTFAWNQEDDCLEGCCDPDLTKCSVLVVGDNEGVQVYSTTGDNTTHLFDVNTHDVKDIAAAQYGNGGFIWVYKVTGGGTQIDEYSFVMAPFTNIHNRTITVNANDIGNGLTYYGINPITNNLTLTSVNDTTLMIELPSGNTNITVTPTTVNNLPTGYYCTGDILTRGGNNNLGGNFNTSLDIVLYDNSSTATGSSIVYKVAKIQRLTGNVLEEHTISPALMTGTTKFHSLYADTINNRLAGITTDGRIYELKQTPTLGFGTMPIGHIDFFNTGGTKTIYGAASLDFTDGTCGNNLITYPPTYSCTINGCIDPGNGTGQYTGPTALADCNTLCVITWNCNPGSGYPNCTNVVKMLPWETSIVNITIPQVQTGPDAILYISTASAGLQYQDFNTIGFYWGIQPIVPGQCVKNNRGQWKISQISHPQLISALPIQSWAQFITELIGSGVPVTMNMTYPLVENALFAHYGQQYQINVEYEPCICTPVPCECTPIIGTTGTFPTSATCMTTCCPTPPCTVCCQANSSNYPQPPYTWMITSQTSPCYCPSQSSQVPCISCNKCCTNGTTQVMLSPNDQNCDCSFYGLYSCYLPPCDKCCYNKHTGMVSPAPLPDCMCKPGEFVVPCNSLPPNIGISCTPFSPVLTATTATTPTITNTSLNPIGTSITVTTNTSSTVVTGTSVNVTSATKIYVFYDTSSLGSSYIIQIKDNIESWLISNGLNNSNVNTISLGNERWLKWAPDLYDGNIATTGGIYVQAPSYFDDVLIISFIDESHPNYHGIRSTIPASVGVTGQWSSDYGEYKTLFNSIQGAGGNIQCVLFPTIQNAATVSGERRGMAIQSLQAISSGNNSPLDGMYQLGTAPRTLASGGSLGGIPELCSIADLTILEQQNPYWSGTLALNGGLDQFGWKINISFKPVTTAALISELNSLL